MQWRTPCRLGFLKNRHKNCLRPRRNLRQKLIFSWQKQVLLAEEVQATRGKNALHTAAMAPVGLNASSETIETQVHGPCTGRRQGCAFSGQSTPMSTFDAASHAAALQRFLDAQAPVHAQAMQELERGCKQSHWMWFLFPQPRGLGKSATAQFYGLEDAQEALAYAQHPVLGERLRACTHAMLRHAGKQSATDILGSVDALKFCSCMGVFARLLPVEPVFSQALQAFCGGRTDPKVLDFCAGAAPLKE